MCRNRPKIQNKSKNDCEVDFQIDTGAEINTINRKYVKKSRRKKIFSKLKMWNRSTVSSLGELY
jgi:hypothetical protein